jgi:hypothetical protein
MKERHSVIHANYTKTREEWYKKECDEILFRTRSYITIEGQEVMIITNSQKKYLLTIDNPKTSWFQIWLKVRDER